MASEYEGGVYEMSESRILSEIESCCMTYKLCVLPRNPMKLCVSVWSMPDPAFHVGVIWRQNVGGFRKGRSFIRLGMPGEADFTGWLFKTGQRIQIEAKTAKGTLSPSQESHRVLCLKTGVLWGVARSYGDCEMVLKSWGLESLR